ncbi:MAG: hypothetical protein PHV13_06235 [Candidatus ainarchaeum sp.]|nr:hypothetical protein [Candidatus ainarchaeum sp.]
MKQLASQPVHCHKSAAKPFAKFVLLGSSLMLLAGCNPGDWRAQFTQRMALQQQGEDRDIAAQRKLIGYRLRARGLIANRITRAWNAPDSAEYRAQLIRALTVHGTVSQAAGEYDTAVIKCLGIYAGGLDRLPATEAAEQLVSIASICRNPSVSMRLVNEALGDALDNPALDWGTKWRIKRVLNKEAVPLLVIPEMPPSWQTPLDSLALRMMAESR